MTFKNAAKLLMNHYRLIWKILLFLAALIVIVASLSVTFAIPVFKAFADSETFPMISTAVKNFLEGGGLGGLFAEVKAIVSYINVLFRENPILRGTSTAWIVVVLTVVYRFVLGLYELPLIHVLDGAMSDGAKHGFSSSFVKLFLKSCYFAAIKMLIMTALDALIGLCIFGLYKLLALCSVAYLAPFLCMLLFMMLWSFRFSLISTWAPEIVCGGKGIFSAFASSAKRAFKNFTALFTMYFIVWMLIISLCLIFGIFTLGAGLIVLIPMSMLFLNLLNITFYYNHNKRRYHLDGQIFDPQTQRFFNPKGDVDESNGDGQEG